jgi:hypothetical protein
VWQRYLGQDTTKVTAAITSLNPGKHLERRLSLKSKRRRWWPFTLLVCVLGAGPVLCAERSKSDVITLEDGERLTGRILYMRYGSVQLNSTHAGDISIEWPSVRAISSKYAFRVETITGEYLAGVISTTPDGKNLVISSDTSTSVTIPMQEVSQIVPYESNFWQRIAGSISLGYNFTKSTEVSQGSAEFTVNYSGVSIDAASDARTVINRSPGNSSDQDQVTSTVYFLRPGRNFLGVLNVLERNQDLGIDGRVLFGGVVGRNLRQTPDSQLTGFVGVDYNQEWAAGGGAKGSAEGVIGGEWRIYKFIYPKANLNMSLLTFPSITDAPRFRASLNVALTFKLTDRFALRLSEYGNYDSRPPEASAQTLDYGVVASVSYDFGAVVP